MYACLKRRHRDSVRVFFKIPDMKSQLTGKIVCSVRSGCQIQSLQTAYEKGRQEKPPASFRFND